jgi:hypothetical protein
MSRPGETLHAKAAQLRRAFDRSFAEAVLPAATAFDDFLAIRLRDDAHLLRLEEVARLLPLRALTRFPGTAPGWLGLAGMAGAVVPVYDLGLLLGYAAAAPPRWMALCRAAPVALAFDAFEGQFRHPRAPDALPGPAPQGELLRTAGQVRPVVSLGAIIAAIRSLAPEGAAQQER